jgi:hypothetical protein
VSISFSKARNEVVSNLSSGPLLFLSGDIDLTPRTLSGEFDLTPTLLGFSLPWSFRKVPFEPRFFDLDLSAEDDFRFDIAEASERAGFIVQFSCWYQQRNSFYIHLFYFAWSVVRARIGEKKY